VVVGEGTAEASSELEGVEDREEETTVLFGRTDQSDAGLLPRDCRTQIPLII